MLFNKGDPSEKFYAIISGQIYIVNQDEEGDELILNTLGVGRSFGERGLVLKQPRSLGVRCKTDVRLIVVNAKDFEKILQFEINADLLLKK